jgi:hypothetical protein
VSGGDQANRLFYSLFKIPQLDQDLTYNTNEYSSNMSTDKLRKHPKYNVKQVVKDEGHESESSINTF